MGSDVISLTAALLSDEYHHSRNLREKTARGSRLAVSQCSSPSPALSVRVRSSALLLTHRPDGDYRVTGDCRIFAPCKAKSKKCKAFLIWHIKWLIIILWALHQ